MLADDINSTALQLERMLELDGRIRLSGDSAKLMVSLLKDWAGRAAAMEANCRPAKVEHPLLNADLRNVVSFDIWHGRKAAGVPTKEGGAA